MPTNSSILPSESHLNVGFILLPHFTLLPFAAFIDALRLAADDGDQSRQIRCHWTVMGSSLKAVSSSCGVAVNPWETFQDPANFDYIVIVGGLLHHGPAAGSDTLHYLQKAAAKQVPLIGLCTGSFALIHAGLMKNRRCCVSWFHYKDLWEEMSEDFIDIIPVAEQLFVDDGDRITCAGGAVAADVAAYIIERHLGQHWARKSLRIMMMDNPRAGDTPQPQPAALGHITNPLVKRAILLLEHNISRPLSNKDIADELGLSKRQLERIFSNKVGESLQKYYRKIRLQYGLWLLQNTLKPVTDIAYECGFADTAHFSRLFRQNFMVTPSSIRKTI